MGGVTAAGFTWDDIDLGDPIQREWLLHEADLDDHARRLLLEGTGVHRRVKLKQGFFVSFGDLSRTDGDEHDEGVSLGLVIEKHRLFTAHDGPIDRVEVARARLATGPGPATPLDLLAGMIVDFADQLEDAIARVSAETERMEDRMLADGDDPPLASVATLRYDAFRIRRRLAARRNLLTVVIADRTLGVGEQEHAALRAALEHVGCYLDELDESRERLQLLHDRMEGQMAAVMNRVSYNLTVVATVFLPLTFLTGLLGMNVAGMPEAHDPWGFWIVCLVLVGIAVGSWWFLRWRRWI